MKEELVALREEIQRDRIAITETINAGFETLGQKIDEHTKDDTDRFILVENRLAGIEKAHKLVGGGIIAAITTAIGAFFGK